jgi:hypothetical protein
VPIFSTASNGLLAEVARVGARGLGHATHALLHHGHHRLELLLVVGPLRDVGRSRSPFFKQHFNGDVKIKPFNL